MTVDMVLKFIASTDDVSTLRKIRLDADKAIKSRRAPKPIVQHYSKWALDCARELWEYVRSRYSFMPEPNMQQWADDIDKLHRLDKYEPQLILFVMQWSQRDPFWRQQVRSGANLRKHFVAMGVRIKEEKSRQGAVTI